MLKNELISKKNINITFVVNQNSDIDFFKKIFNSISIYLKLNVTYYNVNKKNVLDIYEVTQKEGGKIDFIFIDFIKDFEYFFAWNFYSKMHQLNKNFKLVLFKNEIDDDDIKYFKNGADDIIHTNEKYYQDKERYIKWKLFSLLRRKWDTSHKETILNKNGVIVDLVKRIVIVNNKEIKITNKEFAVLTLLVNMFNNGDNKFLSKNKIFKEIYGKNNDFNSRVVDVLLHRLKNKLPINFFEWDKRKGIKIV